MVRPSAPRRLKARGQAFDEAWQNIAGNFGDGPDIERARLKLAEALLSVASEDSRDVEALKIAALEVMASNYRRDWTDAGKVSS
jgi:hypothetical protein